MDAGRLRALAGANLELAVLRDDEVVVSLCRALEVATAEDEAVIARMAGRLHQVERGLDRVIAGHGVLRIPERSGRAANDVEALAHRVDLELRRVVGVAGVGAGVDADFESGGRLRGDRDGEERYEGKQRHKSKHWQTLLYVAM